MTEGIRREFQAFRLESATAADAFTAQVKAAEARSKRQCKDVAAHGEELAVSEQRLRTTMTQLKEKS